MKTLRSLVFLAVFLPSTGAGAQQVVILGSGNNSCGTWMEARRENGYGSLVHQAWVTGYVTAYNNYAVDQDGNVTAGTDADGLMSWIAALIPWIPFSKPAVP
jgi:hypothetical protein